MGLVRLGREMLRVMLNSASFWMEFGLEIGTGAELGNINIDTGKYLSAELHKVPGDIQI